MIRQGRPCLGFFSNRIVPWYPDLCPLQVQNEIDKMIQKGGNTHSEEGVAVLLGLLCLCAFHPHKLSVFPFTTGKSQMYSSLRPGILDSISVPHASGLKLLTEFGGRSQDVLPAGCALWMRRSSSLPLSMTFQPVRPSPHETRN